jgi:hypothetical protein
VAPFSGAALQNRTKVRQSRGHFSACHEAPEHLPSPRDNLAAHLLRPVRYWHYWRCTRSRSSHLGVVPRSCLLPRHQSGPLTRILIWCDETEVKVDRDRGTVSDHYEITLRMISAACVVVSVDSLQTKEVFEKCLTCW